MKRYLITSPKFTGTAEIIYNEKQTLCMIDCTKTNMDEMVVSHFKHAVPANENVLLTGKCFSGDTNIVAAGFIVSFKRFYDEYPLKRNRFRAEKIFEKLTQTNQVLAFYSLAGYKKYLNKSSIFAMGADRYLSERHYETEWEKIK